MNVLPGHPHLQTRTTTLGALSSCSKNARRLVAFTTKTTIGDHQGMLNVIQHAPTIADFAFDDPALLVINR
jgi:hypothetical protein